MVKIKDSVNEYATVEQLLEIQSRISDYTPMHKTLRLEL